MENILKSLNKEQIEAVKHIDGPLLIVAGAGTGKTTVIAQRLAYLFENKIAKPEEVLVLTFTEKAAGEMEERADKALPIGYIDLWISTFHAFCERLLRDHALDIGLTSNFKLLNQTDQWVLIRKNLDKFDLDYYRPLGNPTKFIHELIRHFSRLKDENITPAEYLEYAESLEQNLDISLLGGNKKISKSKIQISNQIQNPNSKIKNLKFKIKNLENDVEPDKNNDQTDEMEVRRITELSNAYHVYNQLLLDNSFLDFGDLITYTLKLFHERPNILKYYREKFKYIMVDEFQDTNWAQYELIKLLSAPKNNLVVVGDDDQCLPGNSLIITKNGQKKISHLKINDEVATAVGKGYLSYSRIKYIKKTAKTARMITFQTVQGKKIETTDNHKMFCHVPQISNKKFYYVYLMHKQELGWRLGQTNDLSLRLRLERSADRILAIKEFETMEEARYFELLISLRYGIPMICFQERGGVMDKKKWSERLYSELDVESGVKRLALDLRLDLNAHQASLDAVNRGGKLRIKINIELCHRNYRSKYSKDNFLLSPQVIHLLSLETSRTDIIKKIEGHGFEMSKAKKGKRLRIASANLAYLGKIAGQLQKITGGIIENKAKLGKTNLKFKPALIIPAGNILPGMYLPVISKQGVIYDQIISRTEKTKETVVYDLEVDRTHNFIANGVVVHNSIYRFRGASMSNILEFKDDFPKAREIVLINNYRSGQNILDRAYGFIKHNNPNRLEAKLKIDKKLNAQGKDKGEVIHWHFATDDDEIREVVKEIIELKKKKGIEWEDLAILVRANDSADKFIAELTRYGIPNQFVSLKGLYFKPIIMDVLAYLRLLDNYHESSALFRVLNMEIFKVSHADIVEINKFARNKAWSTYEALKNIQAIHGVAPRSVAHINKLLALIAKHSQLAKQEKTSRLFVHFLTDSELLKLYDIDKDKEIFDCLNQFYQKIKKLEETDKNLRLKDFIEIMEMEMEAGETGSMNINFEDTDTVKVMTVHAAKGLEFKYVFVVNLVDKKFPTINRGEKISIPDALIKEKVPEGDIHTEEERRLFYVAMTRAKDKLYLTSAADYGGAREKKPSKFLDETEIKTEIIASSQAKNKNGLLDDLKRLNDPIIEIEKNYVLPEKFSFSQVEAFTNCPLQYKYNFILRIPVLDKVNFIFGRVMHNTLRDFLSCQLEASSIQPGLFANAETKKKKPKFDELLRIYDNYWVNDGYATKEDREKYKKKGKKILEDFYSDLEMNGWPQVMFIEKSFNVKIGDHMLKGAIDRVDRKGDSVEIIDYKTGSPKDKLDFDAKRQLILYQIAVEEVFGLKVSGLTFHYLEDGSRQTFVAKDAEITKVKELVIKQIEEIKKTNFPPKPSFLCSYCDFRGICQFRHK